MSTEHEHEREAESAAEEQARESGSPGGGKGRMDTPGRTGVYPMSASEGASGEAMTRAEPGWGQGERGAEGYEDSGDSGILTFMPQQQEATAEGQREQVGEPPAPSQGEPPSAP